MKTNGASSSGVEKSVENQEKILPGFLMGSRKSRNVRKYRDTSPAFVRALIFFAFVFFASTPCLLFGGVRGAEEWGKINDSGPLFPVVAVAVYTLTCIAFALLYRTYGRKFIDVWPIFILVGFAFLSAFWSLNPLLTISKSIALFGTSAVGVLAAYSLSPGQQIRYLLVALTVLMIMSIFMGIATPEIAFDKGGGGAMLHGIYAQKNALGWAAATTALFAIGATLGGVVSKPAGVCALLIAVVAVAWSRSATGIIVIVSATGVYFSFWVLRETRKLWPLTIISSLAFLITTFAFRDFISAQAFSALGKGEDLTGRTTIWSALEEAMMDRPVGGFGFQAFWTDPIAMYYMRGAFFAGNAQGGFHEIVVNIGFVGLILYLSIIVFTAFQLSRRAIYGNQIAMIYATALVCIIIMGVTSPTLLGVNIIYWPIVVMAYLYAASRRRALSLPNFSIADRE